jgi:hypothetical protein
MLTFFFYLENFYSYWTQSSSKQVTSETGYFYSKNRRLVSMNGKTINGSKGSIVNKLIRGLENSSMDYFLNKINIKNQILVFS